MSPRGGRREGAGGKVKDPSGHAKSATFRLAPATLDLIRQLADERGVSQADIITAGVRALTDPPPG